MNNIAYLKFHDELVTMISKKWKNGEVLYQLTRQASIKDIIESLGPPHTEIYTILVNDKDVDFSYQVHDNTKIEIYPAKYPIDITQETVLRPVPLHELRFLADVNVGKLAKLLRMLGFDTKYDHTMNDALLANEAEKDSRIVLSKDKNCLKRSKIIYGKWIREDDPKKQLKNIIESFNLLKYIKPFSRCIVCNSTLKTIEKEKIIAFLQPLTKKYYDKFSICPQCNHIYWAGTHYEKMQNYLQELIK